MDAQFNNPNNEPVNNRNGENPQAENEFLNKEQTPPAGNGTSEQQQAGQGAYSQTQTSFAGNTAYNNGQPSFAAQENQNNPQTPFAGNSTYNNVQTSFAAQENQNNPQTPFAGNSTYNNVQTSFAAQENQNNPQTPFAGNTVYNNAQTAFASQKYVSYLPYGFTPKTFEEKKGIRKAALITGLSVLILMGVSFFWATAYFFVMGRLGIDYNRALEIVSDPAVMQVVQIIISTLMFSVPFIIVFKANRISISETVPLGKPKKGNRLAMFFIGLSLCAFANIANSYAGYFFSSFGINYNVDYGENPSGIFGFLLSFLATAVVPAFMEEFACRGLIMGILRKYGDGFAVLMTAAVFGLMHGNFDQMPFAFMVGLALGYIVVQTNSLWIAVAVHAANNFVSVAFTYLLSPLSADIQNLIYSLYLMAALGIGIAAAAVSGKKILSFSPETTESSFSKKCKWFISSPVIIIFAVVCVLQSLLYFS